MRLILPEFTTKSQLFDYLISNKQDLIDFAKKTVKYADSFGLSNFETTIVKDFNATAVSSDTDTEIKRTIIGNSYNWLDSHDDVHLDGCFAVSIEQNKANIQHLHDHVYQLMAKVGTPNNIYEGAISWTQLGVNKAGYTQSLFMDSTIKKSMNQSIFDQYKAGEIQQHSVGMQYSKIFLAVNDPERKEEYAVWNQYIGMIGNRSKAEEKGYFWAVKEAKLIEISCVIAGSNELTPTLDPTKISQVNTTTDPPVKQSKTIIDYLIN